MSVGVSLRLLGTVQAEWEGEVIHDFGSRKALALLGYLAANAGPVTRSSLVDLFWQDKAEAAGRRNLSWVLSTISSRLPQSLKTDRHTVALNDAVRPGIDIETLGDALRSDDVSALTNAITLYRGEFMEGLVLAGCPGFETWLVSERERWQKRIATALQRLVDYHLDRRELDISRQLADTLLTIEPWREEAHRLMMRLLALSGQRSAALLQYETCRRLLSAELGVEPAPETDNLYQTILQGGILPLEVEPSASTFHPQARRNNIPLPLTPLLGRADALADIHRQLSDVDCRLLTLVGPGGIGKTRLALQTAVDQQEHYRDGVYFVPLATVTGRDVLLTAVAKALEFTFYIQETAHGQLVNYFQEKEILLILDNFEHLSSEAEVVGDWLSRCPGLKVLVTSQARLELRGECLYEVKGLACPAEENQDDLERFSAVQLFVDGALRSEPAFKLTRENARAIGQICRLVDGLPLGLELASSWISMLTVEQIADRLGHSLGSLDSSLADLPGRQRSLQAAFEHSWSLLTLPQQKALMRVSIFRGGFELAAAEQVAGCSLPTLTVLNHRSFLRRIAPGRFEMHESLRQNAAARLVGSAANDTAVAHSRYYAAYVAARRADLVGGRQQDALDEIGTRLDNVRSGWQWAVSTGALDIIRDYAPGLFHYYYMRSWFAEGADAFRRAAGVAAAAGDDWLWAFLTAREGWFSFHIGRHSQAQVLLQRSLAIFERDDVSEEVAFCLTYLAAIIRFLGFHHDALALIQRTLTLSRHSGDLPNLAIALNVRGSIAYSLAHYDEAEQFCRESLALKESLGDRWGMSFSLTLLGRIAYSAGHLDTARSLLEHSLGFCASVNDRRGMAINLNLLGRVATAADQPVVARHFLEESLAITRAIGDRWNIINISRDMATLAKAEGDLALANKSFRDALLTAVDIHATIRTLEIVADFAPLATGDAMKTAVYLSHVFTHPETPSPLRQQVAGQLAALADGRSEHWLAEARRAGQWLTLHDVASQLTAPAISHYATGDAAAA